MLDHDHDESAHNAMDDDGARPRDVEPREDALMLYGEAQPRLLIFAPPIPPETREWLARLYREASAIFLDPRWGVWQLVGGQWRKIKDPGRPQ